jgi:cob(I)alamin adenosyltransferase
MAKIYTKVGDQGQTALLSSKKVYKNHARISAYGTVDELNSYLGWIRMKLIENLEANFNELAVELETLQHWCFDLGAILASEKEDRERFNLQTINESHVKWIESKIDIKTDKLPKLQEFILPGGSELASCLHIARTVARRAEREIVKCLVDEGLMSDEYFKFVIPFINRLSDYLFVSARYVNFILSKSETTWKKTNV